VYLEQYKKCHGADEIETIQNKIMEELESSWNDARKSKGVENAISQIESSTTLANRQNPWTRH
jgi:hypothetical protein